ncbi:MAG: hypothetical protein M0R77_00655 [Gammaproteobacteria bacterium]|nr:hypothetical protein [Gammaproteobacteria bacterium]
MTIDFNAEHVGIRRDAEWLCYAQCSAASRTGGLGGKSLSVIHTGGGNGGLGANNTGSTVQRLGGGGAGGYTSNGGNGGGHNTTQTTSFDGGSGGNYNASFNTCSGGFGVTLLGSRVPGSNGVPVGSPYPPNVNNTSTALRNAPPRGGGRYGGGAAVIYNTTSGNVNGQSSGGVRIIWGEGRSYPYNALDV